MNPSEPAPDRRLRHIARALAAQAERIGDTDLSQRVRARADEIERLADEAAAHRRADADTSTLTDGGQYFHVVCPDCAEGEGVYECIQRARWAVLKHRAATGHAVCVEGVAAK